MPGTSNSSPATISPPAALWQLLAMTRVAVVGDGVGSLSIAHRLLLDWMIQRTADALASTLDRALSVDPSGTSSTQDPVFAIRFSHPQLSTDAILALDLKAARAIVDILQTDFANVRGAGALSDAELGLLEYTALACLDNTVRLARGAARGLVIGDFLSGRELRAAIDGNKTPPIDLTMRLAGRDGAVKLYLPDWPAADILGAFETDGSIADAREISLADFIDVQLALPALRFSQEEFQRLEPGDVVFLGLTDLRMFSSGALVTPTGWSIASAAIVQDTPTTLTIRCGEFHQTIHESARYTSISGGYVLTPLLGSARLPLDQVQHWQKNSTFDLAKDSASPVKLQLGSRTMARGELVKIDGELGVRLVEVTLPAGGTESR